MHGYKTFRCVVIKTIYVEKIIIKYKNFNFINNSFIFKNILTHMFDLTYCDMLLSTLNAHLIHILIYIEYYVTASSTKNVK